MVALTSNNVEEQNKTSDQDIASAYTSQAPADAAEPVRDARGDDTALPAELVRDGALSRDRVRVATKFSSVKEGVRESAPAESTRESVPDSAETRPDKPEFLPDLESAELERRTAGCEPAEPVRDISGVVVKPDRGQLSKESGATDEAGVLSREVTGVSLETGRKTGPLGLYLENTCCPLGVNRRGEEAAELMSVKELYEGALKETTEPPEELVRVRTRPGEERIELAEPDRTVSGDSSFSRRQEREDESDDDDDDLIEFADERPEGGFLLLDGICKKSKYMTRMFVKTNKRKVSC